MAVLILFGSLALYVLIIVIVHALYNRHSLLTHGKALGKRHGSSAVDDCTWAAFACWLWPFIPLMYLGRFLYRKGLVFHNYVSELGLRSHDDADDEDKERGPYR